MTGSSETSLSFAVTRRKGSRCSRVDRKAASFPSRRRLLAWSRRLAGRGAAGGAASSVCPESLLSPLLAGGGGDERGARIVRFRRNRGNRANEGVAGCAGVEVTETGLRSVALLAE
jgi:hypothetical protein